MKTKLADYLKKKNARPQADNDAQDNVRLDPALVSLHTPTDCRLIFNYSRHIYTPLHPMGYQGPFYQKLPSTALADLHPAEANSVVQHSRQSTSRGT